MHYFIYLLCWKFRLNHSHGAAVCRFVALLAIFVPWIYAPPFLWTRPTWSEPFIPSDYSLVQDTVAMADCVSLSTPHRRTTSANSARAFSSQNRSSALASLHTCLPRARPSLWRKQKEDLTVLSSNSWKWACLTSTGFQTTKKPDKTNSVLTSSSHLKVFGWHHCEIFCMEISLQSLK